MGTASYCFSPGATGAGSERVSFAGAYAGGRGTVKAVSCADGEEGAKAPFIGVFGFTGGGWRANGLGFCAEAGVASIKRVPGSKPPKPSSTVERGSLL